VTAENQPVKPLSAAPKVDVTVKEPAARVSLRTPAAVPFPMAIMGDPVKAPSVTVATPAAFNVNEAV
jgi:hypothetical protein